MKEKKIEITKERLERLEGYEQIIDRLKEIGFPTFMSCREYADHIEKLEQDLKHKKIAIQNRKARIKDLEKQIEELKEKHKQDELGLIITNSSARAELEQENKQLKAQIEELKMVVISFKADCNEIGKRAYELEKQIEKMKCGQNCKHSYLYQEDRKCKFTYCDCTNCKDKWELKE